MKKNRTRSLFLRSNLPLSILACGLLISSRSGLADQSKKPDQQSSACFNFDQLIKSPLRQIEFSKKNLKGQDLNESGKVLKPGSGIWGAVQGKVNQPLLQIYQELLDHYTIKDPKKVKLRVYPQEKPGYQDSHLVMVSVATPVADIHWEEEWVYALADGTEADPKKYVISYQKTTGTQFVPHLCGSIVLRAIDPHSTEVYLYEEVDALGKRSPKDTVQGHLGTLATLRTKEAKKVN